jgi:hypothetical protein
VPCIVVKTGTSVLVDDRRLLARGVSRIGARDLAAVRRSPAHERRARRSGRTVIHRDSLVMQDAARAA